MARRVHSHGQLKWNQRKRQMQLTVVVVHGKQKNRIRSFV